MGLNEKVSSLAARHAHALTVEVPGAWRVRADVERLVLDRGWRLADSPADADVLVVCGEPAPQLAEAVALVWQQMPGPRVRVDVAALDVVAARLDDAHRCLLDTGHHRHDARERPSVAELLDQEGDADHGGHGGMDHGDGGHDGMDHGDMEMSPGGIPLAEGGEDRDGLEMDVLTVRLGPVLRHWPPGLVLRCSLQGDVVTTARAAVVDGHNASDGEEAPRARTLDNVASLLALAGWDDAAARARRLRDAVFRDDPGVDAGVARLHRQVRRSWPLRWSLRGLGVVTEADRHHHGLPDGAGGDTYDRLLRMLDRAAGTSGAERVNDLGRPWAADHIAHLVSGLDLATARLVVAGLDVHRLRAPHGEHEASHG